MLRPGRRTRSAALAALALAALAAPRPGRAQGNPFRDVPADHWSLAAVRRLADEGLVEGFPDGTYKGKKVVTRYDMAIHLAKLLARVDRVRAAGRAGISPEDAVTVTRLTTEYKQELDLLGVKVDALEERLGTVERTTKKLEKDLSNVRLDGLYQLQTYFVDEPFDFTRYPFSRGRNPYLQFRRAGDFPGQFSQSDRARRESGDTAENRTGLQPIQHTVFLRFTGNPFALDGLNRNVETFVELRGDLSGPAEDRLTYRFSDPPIAGDNLDDFATGVVDQRRVSVNRAHLKVKSKRLDIRAFAEEASTDYGGPLALFTAENYAAQQGLEVDGAYKKLAYQGSVLKEFSLDSALGFNRDDLYEEFVPESVTAQDAFGFRFSYRTDEEDVKNRLILGTTYAELVEGYEEANTFNRAIGFDALWEHRSEAEVDVSGTIVNTVGSGDRQDWGGLYDVSYERDRLNLTGKFYHFGRDWDAALGVSPFVERGINGNFRHGSTTGERAFRGQARYTADDTLLRNIESLVFNLTYVQKWWEADPDDPSDEDGNTARSLTLRTIADLTEKTHVEWTTQYIKDVLENEKGELVNRLQLDLTLFGETTASAELEFRDDYDRENDDRSGLSTRRGQFEVNSQISDEFFAKGYVETIKNDDRALTRDGLNHIGQERNRNDGLDVNRVGGEFTYAIEDDFSLKGYGERETVEDLLNPERDGTFDRWAFEGNLNFTRALNLRYVRGYGDFDRVTGEDEFIINNFAQLQYQPTEGTEFLLTYGLEYEEGGFPPDRGPLVFWRTNKTLSLSAQTRF